MMKNLIPGRLGRRAARGANASLVLGLAWAVGPSDPHLVYVVAIIALSIVAIAIVGMALGYKRISVEAKKNGLGFAASDDALTDKTKPGCSSGKGEKSNDKIGS